MKLQRECLKHVWSLKSLIFVFFLKFSLLRIYNFSCIFMQFPRLPYCIFQLYGRLKYVTINARNHIHSTQPVFSSWWKNIVFLIIPYLKFLKLSIHLRLQILTWSITLLGRNVWIFSQKWDNVGKKLKIKSMVTIEFDINEWHYLVHSIVVPHNAIYSLRHIL